MFQVIGTLPTQQDLLTLEKTHQNLVSFYDVGNYSEALNLLFQIKEQNPNIYILNSYAYLEGKILQKLAYHEDATKAYETLLENNSILSDYVLFHIAEIYSDSDNTDKQRLFLEKLLQSFPKSSFSSEARFQLADLYRRDGEYEKALTHYRYLSTIRNRNYKYEALLQAGKIYRKIKQPQAALQKFYRLLQINSLADIALEAAKEIEQIEKRSSSIKLSDKKIWLKEKVYFQNRNYSKAIRYGTSLLSKFPQSQWADDTYYYLGLAHLRCDETKRAKAWFQRLIEAFPKSALKAACQYQLGTMKLAEEDEKSALEYFSSIVEEHPTARWAQAALIKIITCHFQREDIAEGKALINTMITKYSDSSYLAEALIRTSKACWEKEETNLAFEYLELISTGEFSPGKKAEALYWKAKLNQKLGQNEQAVECFKKLIAFYPNNYYCFRAQQQILENPKLKKLVDPEKIFIEGEMNFTKGDFLTAKTLFVQSFYLSPDENLKQRSAIMLAHCYSQLEEYKDVNTLKILESRELITVESTEEKIIYILSQELLFLHIYDEAVTELTKNIATLDDLYSLSLFCQKADFYSKSIQYAEQIGLNLPQDYCFAALSENLKALLYPIYYYDIIHEYSQLRGIDELLLSAVIREESRFDCNAKSSASARGLMQFIPSTAKYISRTLGVRNFELESLYDPEYSIKIGSKYLQNLLKEFKGNYLAALAAYNAGEHNVYKWLRATKNNDPDQILLEITFRETREYVKRVMSSYWKYNLLFSSNRFNNNTIEFPVFDELFSQLPENRQHK